jgi:hypothetical protein
MCIFITVIAKASDKELVSDILINAGCRAEVIDNPSLGKRISEDEIQFISTTGHCNCDTVLGYEPDSSSDKFAANIKKLKRKKWSQAKIDRYIVDQEKTAEKKENQKLARGGDSVEMWADIISTALDGGAQKLGLFFRMYSGLIVSENFEPTVRTVKFKDFEKREFRELKENEICYFR